MRLLLADDHALFRDALVHYIERTEPDADIVLAKDFHEVMDIMEGRPALDLILLDMRMPGMEGLQGLQKLRENFPETAVALISGVAEKHQIEEAINMGASGFFPKTMSGKAMLNGVHKILNGEKYVAVDHNTNDVMPSYYNNAKAGGAHDDAHSAYAAAGAAKLTPRESEVLTHLLRGASNKEIARDLDLQVVTVKLHVRGICRKLGAKNRTQAALRAQEMGLITNN